MIRRLIRERPMPRPQDGTGTVFRRRVPADSDIPQVPTVGALYDFIRMLDAQGYPRAFLTHGGFRYEFRNARLRDGQLRADVTIASAGEAES